MSSFASMYSRQAYRSAQEDRRIGIVHPLFEAFPCPDFQSKLWAPDAKPADWLSLGLHEEAARILSANAPPPLPPKARLTPEHEAHNLQVMKLAAELMYVALYSPSFVFPTKYKTHDLQTRQIIGGLWGDMPVVDNHGNIYRGDSSQANNHVPQGPVRNRIMVVGKMPGQEETNLGRNQVGKPARILRKAITDCGVDPTDWYVTSAIRWPHPDPKGGSALPPLWTKTCYPLLRYEIELVQPEYVLLMGNEAMWAVLGKDGGSLESNKFRILDAQVGDHKFKAVVCLHPGFVMRQTHKEPDMKKMIRGFVELTQTGNAWQKETDYVHLEVRTIEQLEELSKLVLEATPTEAIIAFDCEWEGIYPTEPEAYLRSVQFSWLPRFAAAIVMHDEGGIPVLWPHREKVTEILNRIAKSTPGRPVRIAGHNFNADHPWLKHMGFDPTPECLAPFNHQELIDFPSSTEAAELTRTQGGFDTMLAAHSVKETDEFKLELQGVSKLNLHRYDEELQEWKKSHLRANKMKEADLEGYGQCPGAILIGKRGQVFPFGIQVTDSYACYDTDVTRRLVDHFNGVNGRAGTLDHDEFGNSSRIPFWRSMLASATFGEFHMTGVGVNMKLAGELSDLYVHATNALIEHLRVQANWPEFNPNSVNHCRELLFGPEIANQRDKVTGALRRSSPPNAVLAMVQPYKTTGKRAKLWADVVAVHEEDQYSPSTDKEVLQVLEEAHPHVKLLRAIRTAAQVTKFVMRPGEKITKETLETEGEGLSLVAVNVDGVNEGDFEIEYGAGMLSFVHKMDGRIRSQFFQTKETGRASTARPPLQNLGKSAESNYEKVFHDYQEVIRRPYVLPIRAVITSRIKFKLVDADWTGAELLVAAAQTGDKNMIEHVTRAALPEDHPDFYDIHSNVAVKAFRLTCAPTKKGLADAGFKSIRVAAKACVFGTLYGQGADSLARKARQEKANITTEQAQQLIDGLFEMYPALPAYFAECRRRSQNPRYLVNCFGRRRRFEATDDRQTIGEQERQAMNFPIQSTVADAMNMALHHLYWYRYEQDDPEKYYYNVLQVHDAVVLEAPNHCLDWVVDEVIPTCMSNRVEIWSCFLDGNRNPAFDKPFRLQAPPADVFNQWSVGLKRSQCLAEGINTKYALRCDRCSKQVTGSFDLNSLTGLCGKCHKAASEAASTPLAV